MSIKDLFSWKNARRFNKIADTAAVCSKEFKLFRAKYILCSDPCAETSLVFDKNNVRDFFFLATGKEDAAKAWGLEAAKRTCMCMLDIEEVPYTISISRGETGTDGEA